MYTFTVEIEFSDDVLATAFDVSKRDGDEAADAYLERLVDRALEGGYFTAVTVTIEYD